MNTHNPESSATDGPETKLPTIHQPNFSEIISYLRDSNNNQITSRGVNLRPLKKAVSMLPPYCNPEIAKKLLDEIHAILFHILFPLRVHCAKEWFDENYNPGKSVDLSDLDKEKAIELLTAIGLFKKSEPINRRL